MKTLPIAAIRTDGGTQPRDHISIDVVARYAEEIDGGAEFPPAIVFHDGKDYWLADGFHRLCAYETLKQSEMPCEVRQGTQRDAVLFSVGANATHGCPRSNADKRRAVLTLLRDDEWTKWSNREIARRCLVDEKLVRRIREEATPLPSAALPQIERKVERGGTVYIQNTANIGRPKPETDATIFDQTSVGRADADVKPSGSVFRPKLDPSRAGRAVWLARELTDALGDDLAIIARSVPTTPEKTVRIFRFLAEKCRAVADEVGHAAGGAKKL